MCLFSFLLLFFVFLSASARPVMSAGNETMVMEPGATSCSPSAYVMWWAPLVSATRVSEKPAPSDFLDPFRGPF